jgi:hypothetical protein
MKPKSGSVGLHSTHTYMRRTEKSVFEKMQAKTTCADERQFHYVGSQPQWFLLVIARVHINEPPTRNLAVLVHLHSVGGPQPKCAAIKMVRVEAKLDAQTTQKRVRDEPAQWMMRKIAAAVLFTYHAQVGHLWCPSLL